MVKSCCAANCKVRYEKGISFYKFPKDEELIKKWLIAMKRPEWMPSKYSMVCNYHFKEDDFTKSGWTKVKQLKPDAIPTIFDIPACLKKVKKRRLPPKTGFRPILIRRSRPYFVQKSLPVPAVDSDETGNKVAVEIKLEPSTDQETDTILDAQPCTQMDLTCENENAPDHDKRSENRRVTFKLPLKQKIKKQRYFGNFKHGNHNKALKDAKKTINEKGNKVADANKSELSTDQETDTIPSAQMDVTCENENAPGHDEKSKNISATLKLPLEKKIKIHNLGDFEPGNDNKALEEAKKTIDEKGNKVADENKSEPPTYRKCDIILKSYVRTPKDIAWENENLPGHNKRSENKNAALELPLKKKKQRLHYLGDFKCSNDNKALEVAKKIIVEKNKKLKHQNKKVGHLTKRVKKLEQLVHHLKEKCKTTGKASQNLLSSVPESSRALVSQLMAGERKCGKKYPAELKSFALTLDVYSHKAYDLVRATFQNSLPHRRTLQKWYKAINSEPEISTELLEAIKENPQIVGLGLENEDVQAIAFLTELFNEEDDQ